MYLGRTLSKRFKDAHDNVRVGFGLTEENSKLVRFTNWVENGNFQQKVLKGVLLFLVLCIILCVFHLIVIFTLARELYYLYAMSDFRQRKNLYSLSNKRETLEHQNEPRQDYKRRQSKVQLNKVTYQSFSILLRITEMCTESIIMLIAQLYIAIYNDFHPGSLQIFAMITSFGSLVMGTFYWNSEFPWDRKYADGLKAVPLYVLAIAYKSLSITTLIAVFSYYACIPFVVLLLILGVIIYKLTSDNTKNVFNSPAVYVRYAFYDHLSLIIIQYFNVFIYL